MARQVLPIVGAAIDIYFGGNGQVGYMIGSAHGPSVAPEVIEVEPAPIGAIFGGEAGAELVFPSKGEDEPA